MNIFDLRGPTFLAVYFLASVVGLGVFYVLSRRAPSGGASLPTPDARRLLRDPYLLAFLRGGAEQTLQTVAFSLSERGLLTVLNKGLIATGERGVLTHPLEVAVFAECGTLRKIGRLLHDKRLRKLAEDFAAPLTDAGLVADSAEKARRLRIFLVVTGALLAMSVLKISIALRGGHSNIAFLLMLTVVMLTAAVVILKRRRTAAGDRALIDQQTLFAELKGRVKRRAVGGATGEAVLIAAAFGLAALPSAAYPFANEVHRQAQSGGGGCGGSSGCGGGGGGGGGCGGCGGGG